MQIKKQNVKPCKTVYEGEIKSSADGSIIVPDVKPDIVKVLQADAEAFVKEKNIDDGRITVKGLVNVNVLYLPEGGKCRVQCLKSSFEFCETLKRSEFEEGMTLAVCCDTEKVGYKLINSRKISVEAHLAIGVQVIGKEEFDCVSDIAESTAQMQMQNFCICGDGEYDEFRFQIEDTAELPDGKEPIAEILKSGVSIYDKEYKTLNGKLVVKGNVCVNVLYSDVNGGCSYYSFEVPFTEVFDMDGITESARCGISYEISSADAAVMSDANGEMRCISFTAEILTAVRTEYKEEISAVADCFFTDCGCELLYSDIETTEINERIDYTAILKETLQKGQGMPDIAGVYNVCAKPYITAAQLQNGKLAVSGRTIVYVLYVTENSERAVCNISGEIPFGYMIECENSVKGAQTEITAECSSISYAVTSPGAVEIRCGLKFSGKTLHKSTKRVITDIKTAQLPPSEKGFAVCFTEKGETLWDIAKRYHVSEESICACNEGETAELCGGEKLIIPV